MQTHVNQDHQITENKLKFCHPSKSFIQTRVKLETLHWQPLKEAKITKLLRIY